MSRLARLKATSRRAIWGFAIASSVGGTAGFIAYDLVWKRKDWAERVFLSRYRNKGVASTVSAVAAALVNPRCIVCENPIPDWEHLKYPDDHAAVCGEHGNLPSCVFCERLICERWTGGGEKRADGATCCSRCNATAVTSPEEAETIFQNVGLDLADSPLIGLNDMIISLHLGTYQQLQRHHPHHAGVPHPQTVLATTAVPPRSKTPLLVGALTWTRSADITLLSGMPRELVGPILAHELCHAWFYLVGFPQLPTEVEEALAEYIRYRWLRSQRNPACDALAAKLAKDGRHASSLPLWRVLEYLRAGGKEGELFRFVKLYRTLPPIPRPQEVAKA